MAEKTLVNFTDHARKQVFRNLWAKPLLQHISQKLGKKLVYMGLPGVDALDIKEWIEYLNIVFAFQCLDEDKEYEEALAEYDSLNEYLNSLTIKGKLADYNLYQGFLEQTVMTGLDATGNEFNQNEHITVYNLDFCNPLASPYDVVFPDNTVRKCTKLEATGRLLQHQNSLAPELQYDKFLMFVTVNSQFFERSYDDINFKVFKDYKKHINAATAKEKEIRLLRAYAFYHLCEVFHENGYQVEFLPTMYYAGSGGFRTKGTNQWNPTMMLTFTVIGSKIPPGQNPVRQDLKEFLDLKFLFATDTALSCYRYTKVAENDFDTTPVTSLEAAVLYNKFWI